ncbi:hypothetical protein EG68_11504 [Paragonimus skrjabini miyazakii]|uniref:BZIP domain-containing protein n=1 Tax=Paragonimus skrjabini miyazakii TaxID=59628 RepID=A0A8S9YA06_9TREM|nr:hypothetical protein EG68_11504 [Paragonimus skrjabini miyazakii]
MFQNTYELRDLWDNKSAQLRNKGQPECDVNVYSAPNTIDSAFLGPTLWDDLLTISDLEDINLEDFSPSVLESHLSTSDSECAFADNLKSGYAVLSDATDLKQSAGASANKASWSDAEYKTPGATKCSEIPSAAASIKNKSRVPSDQKNEKYWNRRIKNNASAKRSRDARRMMEKQAYLRASILERENEQLKFELRRLAEENMALRQLLNTDPPRTLQLLSTVSNGSVDPQSVYRPLLDSVNSSRTALFTNTTRIRPNQPKTVTVSTSSIVRL